MACLAGVPAAEAVAWVRRNNPGAVETHEQELWVGWFARRFGSSAAMQRATGVRVEGRRACPPARSSEQRRKALQQANEVRSARARLKNDLATGRVGLAPILAQPPRYVRTARVFSLLLVLPQIGPVRAQRMLTRCKIAQRKTIAGIDD
jgi:hypothetical protein